MRILQDFVGWKMGLVAVSIALFFWILVVFCCLLLSKVRGQGFSSLSPSFFLLAVLEDLGCKSTERIPSLRRWALNSFGPSCQRYPGLRTSLFRDKKKVLVGLRR